MEVSLRLAGDIPAKKNLYRFSKRGVYRVKEVEDAIRSLEVQARSQWRTAGMNHAIEHPEIEFFLTFKEFRKDRDNSVTTLLDVLQAAGVLVSDNASRCNGIMTIHPAKRGVPGCDILLRFHLDPPC